ncbi:MULTISPECIES: threonine/serine exporter family protein [unclassified Moraxella]|uniref:threonine/serine exporter family protein n=1 Tax=unclassified Moraxella TaxID=2685852 RepID=UPI003AF7FF76
MLGQMLINWFEAIFFASIMTLGWSLMVNVPRVHLWKCVLMTVLGFGLRNVLLAVGTNLTFATFISATVTAFLAIYLAKRYLITPKTVLVPALLCMMPGVPAYKAMLTFVQLGFQGYHPVLFAQMMNYALEALFVTSALVFGLSLPATIFYRKQPIV